MSATTTGVGLEQHGIEPEGEVLHSRRRRSSTRTRSGAVTAGWPRWPLVVDTGRFTGRSPKDKFVVREPSSEERIWWGDTNAPIEAQFDGLRQKVVDHLAARPRLYVIDAFAGADPAHRSACASSRRARTTRSSRRRCSSARSRRSSTGTSPRRSSCTPRGRGRPRGRRDGHGRLHRAAPSRSEVVIGGTFYAGEIKKSIFTVMNDRLPLEGVFPMHCSANVGPDGDVAIFFGLSGTGKTTLSADPRAP